MVRCHHAEPAPRMTLISSHFLAQARRPSELWDVDVAGLTPYHRALLVNDGTVTQLVEASVLESVEVDALDECAVQVDDEARIWLDLPTATSVVRRRIAIRGCASGRTYAFAESLLVPSRLPSDFSSSLQQTTKGLGEALARVETRRELLWFGLAAAPAWAVPAGSSDPLLTRSYRIIVAGSPSILITEGFPLDDPTKPPAKNQIAD